MILKKFFTMKSKQNPKQPTFRETLLQFAYHHDLPNAFSDFLTLCICAFTQNPLTGKSHYEDLYLQTIEPYKKSNLHNKFPELLSCLIMEMEDLSGSTENNDVLGHFYETELYKKHTSQYFTPYPICNFMASSIMGEVNENTVEPISVIDPCCGSGRMLLAGSKFRIPEKRYEFHGIDIDPVCVKMTAINLFLNGVFHSEVMQANALDPDSFEISYRISLLPFGIYKITEKEKSPLWNRYHHSFLKLQESDNLKPPIEFIVRSEFFQKSNSQLKLF